MFQLSHSKALRYLSSYNDPTNYVAVHITNNVQN